MRDLSNNQSLTGDGKMIIELIEDQFDRPLNGHGKTGP